MRKDCNFDSGLTLRSGKQNRRLELKCTTYVRIVPCLPFRFLVSFSFCGFLKTVHVFCSLFCWYGCYFFFTFYLFYFFALRIHRAWSVSVICVFGYDGGGGGGYTHALSGSTTQVNAFPSRFFVSGRGLNKAGHKPMHRRFSISGTGLGGGWTQALQHWCFFSFFRDRPIDIGWT